MFIEILPSLRADLHVSHVIHFNKTLQTTSIFFHYVFARSFFFNFQLNLCNVNLNFINVTFSFINVLYPLLIVLATV